LITGFTAKQNERTLSGITILIIFYSIPSILNYSIDHKENWQDLWHYHKWSLLIVIFAISQMYFVGRWIGHFTVIIKGKKRIEQDIYLDFNKKLESYFAKIRKKQS